MNDLEYLRGQKILLKSDLCADVKKYLRMLNLCDWPSLDELNAMAIKRSDAMYNANGMSIRFVEQLNRPQTFEDGFEQRTFLLGEVPVRQKNWHDLLNALTWFLFPNSKAALNARHFAVLKNNFSNSRTPEGDALTIFDEDGMIVISQSSTLTDLLVNFEWIELFSKRREMVVKHMSFFIFGHGLLEKTMKPYVGMTGKALILKDTELNLKRKSDISVLDVDLVLSQIIPQKHNFLSGRSLSPLPILGIPGWWTGNEDPRFYENKSYFRKKRK